jgi:Transcriptional regulators
LEGYSLKEDLLEMFHRGIHLLHRSGPHLRRHGRQSTMPPAQGRLMRLLAATGPVAQRTLGDILDIRSASLSELLTKLDKSGWIRRRPNETDKRTMDIELTEEGEKMLNSIGNERTVMAEEVFGALDEEELRQLHGLLGKLIDDWETRFESEGRHCGRGRPGHAEGRFEQGPGWFERLRGKFHHHHHCSCHGRDSEYGENRGHHHSSEHGHGHSEDHGGYHSAKHSHNQGTKHHHDRAKAERCTPSGDKRSETE